jgi:hypothetical protein
LGASSVSAKFIMWREFHFESNQVFGQVWDRAKWEQLKKTYEKAYPDSDIYACKESKYRSNDFGQRSEHQGERTLRQFFKIYGMDLI